MSISALGGSSKGNAKAPSCPSLGFRMWPCQGHECCLGSKVAVASWEGWKGSPGSCGGAPPLRLRGLAPARQASPGGRGGAQ